MRSEIVTTEIAVITQFETLFARVIVLAAEQLAKELVESAIPG